MKKSKMIFSTIMVVVFLVLELCIVSYILESKASIKKYHDFFSKKREYDVLYVGSSYVLAGFHPMEIWEEYGITSFNIAGPSNTIPTSYWVLRNALNYTTPKVVVVDGSLIGTDYKISGDNYSSVHVSLDAFPLSITKIKAVLDLLNDDKIEEGIAAGKVTVAEQRTPLGLLWDFSIYHSRWDSLTVEDFNVPYECAKGSYDLVGITPVEVSDTDEIKGVDSVGLKYLEKIIDECNARGIKVVLTTLPSLPAEKKSRKQANWLEQYANENGIDFINFMSGDFVNPTYDFFDTKGHLNPSGAKKVSDYLGEYLNTNYFADNNKGSDEINNWNSDLADYIDYKLELLHQQEDISLYLMLLCDSSFECNLNASDDFINENKSLIENINCLGKITVDNDMSNMELVESIGDIPDARLTVYRNKEVVDDIYIYNGNIIR